MGMGGMLEEVDMMILMKMSRKIGALILRLVSLTQQYKLHFILRQTSLFVLVCSYFIDLNLYSMHSFPINTYSAHCTS